MSDKDQIWPELPYEAWKDTYATLHLWTQIVGKIRLAQTPWLNHSWHVTLYVTDRGLTTSPIPYGEQFFQIDFDFIDHVLRLTTDDGTRQAVKLAPKSVAAFRRELFQALARLGLDIRISDMPNEIADALRFSEDETHASYDPQYAERLWRVLLQSAQVFGTFRSAFIGKCSPVHFFWGSFDLAVTRFSGRRAPPHPGGVPHLSDAVVREAYSHEVSSAGFWPGNEAAPYPAYYSYAYPEPPGFATASVRPAEAFYSTELREYLLPYDAVRKADDPEQALMDFLMSTYVAAAENAKWKRAELDGAIGKPGVPRPI